MQAFEKVKKFVIDPVVAYYGGPPFTQLQVEAFVEDLGGYSPQALQAAFRLVRQLAKTRPNVAHFVEAIRELSPPTEVRVSSPTDRKQYTCHRNTALASEVMRSPVGQLALKHGVGIGIWMLAWRDGIRSTESDVWRQKEAWQQAVDKLAAHPNKQDQGYRSLEGIYQGFVEKEDRLRKKYATS
jgi:hypothetical protein